MIRCVRRAAGTLCANCISCKSTTVVDASGTGRATDRHRRRKPRCGFRRAQRDRAGHDCAMRQHHLRSRKNKEAAKKTLRAPTQLGRAGGVISRCCSHRRCPPRDRRCPPIPAFWWVHCWPCFSEPPRASACAPGRRGQARERVVTSRPALDAGGAQRGRGTLKKHCGRRDRCRVLRREHVSARVHRAMDMK